MRCMGCGGSGQQNCTRCRGIGETTEYKSGHSNNPVPMPLNKNQHYPPASHSSSPMSYIIVIAVVAVLIYSFVSSIQTDSDGSGSTYKPNTNNKVSKPKTDFRWMLVDPQFAPEKLVENGFPKEKAKHLSECRSIVNPAIHGSNSGKKRRSKILECVDAKLAFKQFTVDPINCNEQAC